MRFIKKVAARGGLTLPSDLRDAMDIQEGDIVEFEVLAVIRRKTPAEGSTQKDTSPQAVPQ